MRTLLVLFLLLGSMAPAPATSAPLRHHANTVVRDATGWKVTYRSVPSATSRIVVDGTSQLLFPNAAAGAPGSPGLPVDVITIGIPAGVTVVAQLSDPVYEDLEGQRVAPFPAYAPGDSGTFHPVYATNVPVYSRNDFIPHAPVTVAPLSLLRQQRIATIRISPYQFNPVTGTLRRLVSGTIHIIPSVPLPGGPALPAAAADPDPQFAPVLRAMLGNYEEARQWRVPRTAPGRRSAMDPTRDWFETGRQYLRMAVGEDGWFRVTPAEILAGGGHGFDPASVRVYHKGNEVPVVVRPDSSVEFAGIWNRGDTTYFDTYTDTSAYWMTWGGTPGVRFVTSGSLPAHDVHTQSSWIVRHFEQNTAHYRGATAVEISDNDEMPGEGWVWEYYFPNSVFSHQFVVDGLDSTAQPTAQLRARLFGTTAGSLSHRARFWVNDSLAGDITFPERQAGNLDVLFPVRWLHNGTNTLTIRWVDTGTLVNQFYLDWFEIGYQRFHTAGAGRLDVVVPPVSGMPRQEFSFGGFAGAGIEVYDLTRVRRVTGGVVTGDSVNGFTITFSDSVPLPVHYVAVTPSGMRPVPLAAAKVFTDIRSNLQGADFIIISHRNFLTAAHQLAAHRTAVNGVRTAVIDVGDIYDEFNYGMMNVESIKAFVRFAYDFWPSPAPAYILLLGDASHDFHKYSFSNPTFIPSHGIPPSDNWLGCFDTTNTFLSSLAIGRIPVTDSLQAQRVVQKLIGYDTPPVSEWNKSALFITGGSEAIEQSSFNFLSENAIGSYITVPPLGGQSSRVYKSSTLPVDGSMKQQVRAILADGVSFINFIGHSSGVLWTLDIGSAYEQENMTGKLPFISSVSCNIAFFSGPATVLSEDYLLADNRGAIGVWGAVSLGYANTGQTLTNHFLSAMVNDSLRGFGELTTLARYRLWQSSGGGYIVIGMIKLTPLIGDPLSRMAIPTRADLALASGDVRSTGTVLTAGDSTQSITVTLRNYGLVPADSVAVRIDDLFDGTTSTLATLRRGPVSVRDSVRIPWEASGQIGRHVLSAIVDPLNLIDEENELNNTASSEQYVYANNIAIVRPLNAMVVQPGPQRLVVTSPHGTDSTGYAYTFQIDTTETFASPWKIEAGPIQPGPVSAEWTTPFLPSGRVFFWRSRASYLTVDGSWVTGSFSTSPTAPPLPGVRIREFHRGQFATETLVKSAATDSGVTLRQNPAVTIVARSLGGGNGAGNTQFGSIRAGDFAIDAFPWAWGNGFICLRYNPVTGAVDRRGFDVPGVAAHADSMKVFIRNTPVGSLLAVAVISNGRTNVSESLYTAIESLGSTQIRQVVQGNAWCLISRQGYPGEAIELRSADSTTVGRLVPSVFATFTASMTTAPQPLPLSWSTLQWSPSQPAGTSLRLAVLGQRTTGATDTLRILPADSTIVAPGFLNDATGGDLYSSVGLSALLSSTVATVSPLLRDWMWEFVPGPDLAISGMTVGTPALPVERGTDVSLPVTVHNIGFSGVDSATILVSLYDRYNKARPIAMGRVDSIPAGGTGTVGVVIATDEFPRHVTLQVQVFPSKRYKDIQPANNIAYVAFDIVGAVGPGPQVFADGVQLMDGDFIAGTPRILVRSGTTVPQQIELLVDGVAVGRGPGAVALTQRASVGEDQEFSPVLSTGMHMLVARVIQHDVTGEADTVRRELSVRVTDEVRILNLYNFPNPFGRETWFSFTLTGARAPDETKIRIFTVAGRKVREIFLPGPESQVGVNKVFWDGRDNDGDELANGYYFYQVTVRVGGSAESAIGKLVKVR